METLTYVDQLARNAKRAAALIRTLTTAQRNAVLLRAAALLREQVPALLAANALDLSQAATMGLSKSMVDRLTLTPSRIEDMAKALDEISAFPDPLNHVIETRAMANGAQLSRISSPIGAVLFIYESRPNVTIDGAALCFKSGNAVVLRGGKESLASSQALAQIFRQALSEHGVDSDAVQLVNTPDREVVNQLLLRNDALDLVIPRGGESLIRTVVAQARMPVIKHYNGICHIYVDQSANLAMAKAILVNAKVQRPSACNAMETLLLDRRLADQAKLELLQALVQQGVTLYGCAETQALYTSCEAIANPDQYKTEYLDLKCSVRIVSGVEEAVAHIEEHSSRHTESVIAEDPSVAAYFLNHVDSSSVMHNASTRLADGGVYGLGAEVGISTDKLHARGPMGVESLCTYKWIVRGSGQIR